MKKFSICIIAKNEEKHIGECIRALSPLGMEILLCDTGSSDTTVSIAEGYGCRVVHFEWTDDFSAARNYCMEQASCDLVLFVDADEILEEYDLPGCLKAASEYGNALGQIRRRNLCNDGNGGTTIYIDLVERFFDRRLYRYEGRIHEQPARRDGGELSAYVLPLTFYHEGYYGTAEELEKKAERNDRLLQEELKTSHSDPYIYYQLGQSRELVNDKEKAAGYYGKALELAKDLRPKYIKMCAASLISCLCDLGRAEEASALGKYSGDFGDYADYVSALAYTRLLTGDIYGAVKDYERALTLDDYNDESLARALPHHNLGCIYEAMENLEAAEEHFRLAYAAGHLSSMDRLKSLPDEDMQEKYFSFALFCGPDTEARDLEGLFSTLEWQLTGMAHLQLCIHWKALEDDAAACIASFRDRYPESVRLILPDDVPAEDTVEAALAVCTGEWISVLKPSYRLHPGLCRSLRQLLASTGDWQPFVLSVQEADRAPSFENVPPTEPQFFEAPADALFERLLRPGYFFSKAAFASEAAAFPYAALPSPLIYAALSSEA